VASSISPLNSLCASAWPAVATPSSSSGEVSATAEVQALVKSGNVNALLNDSVAAAILQPANGVNSGAGAATLVNNLLQTVLAAYRTSTVADATDASG